ncbi:hypothetical protein AVEN_132869-1 [Araneus ventricosus]|uniref:Uncharacterized protein n=1 Tax=Araneus ventricosus TaxID=182803 RepID=A0A4Y2GTD0_ARAVE|nr:hypothetical protein AVEN_132869-1 [Araneus ventricosus]
MFVLGDKSCITPLFIAGRNLNSCAVPTTHNLQQPIGTVLRTLSVNSLALVTKHLLISLQSGRAIPQTLKQKRFFEVSRRGIRRTSSKERRNTEHGNGLYTWTLLPHA